MPIKTAPKGTSAVSYLRRTYIDGNPEREASLAEEEANAEIATAIYNLRNKAGLSQEELALRVGTQKSAISRLEDSDYAGHSLAMLRRIATALGYHVKVTFTIKGSVAAQEFKLRKHQKIEEIFKMKRHPVEAASKSVAAHRTPTLRKLAAGSTRSSAGVRSSTSSRKRSR